MRRSLCILLFCVLLLTGCSAEPTHIVNDADKDEPIRIVATIQSSSPMTAPPVSATPIITLAPTKAPAPAPTDTPAPAGTSTIPVVPGPNETAAMPTAIPGVTQREQFIMIAQQYQNYPYTRGGQSPQKGFDPSGFVYWCLREMGLDVKHRTSAGYSEEEKWQKITRLSELEPGDLLFFKTGDNENINCVCIYLGNNQMIYPSTSKQAIIVAEINSYWTNAFQWARRVF